MIDFKKEADAVFEEVTELRRDFHMHPESSQKEFRTASVIAKYLENLGIEVDRNCAGELPGVCGLLRGGRTGPTVALRADIDALHIQEENNCEYRSRTDGVMHACGHDCHTAILMGTAKVLAKHQNELEGNVKFFFEPAEEDIGGAKFMVQHGVMNGVDAVFGLHMDPMYPAGQIAVCPGEMTAASDHLFITIKGKSVHGARPHLGVDAIMIAGHFLTAVQSMIARQKDPFEHAVITFGQINGGTARNIVCDEVEIKGICRTMNPKTRELLNKRLESLLAGITEAFGGSYELKRRQGHPSLRNNPAMTDYVVKCAGKLIGEDQVRVMPRGSLEAESFAYFSEMAPGSFYRLGCANKEKGITSLLHTPYFDVDESCLKLGVAMQSALAAGYHKISED